MICVSSISDEKKKKMAADTRNDFYLIKTTKIIPRFVRFLSLTTMTTTHAAWRNKFHRFFFPLFLFQWKHPLHSRTKLSLLFFFFTTIRFFYCFRKRKIDASSLLSLHRDYIFAESWALSHRLIPYVLTSGKLDRPSNERNEKFRPPRRKSLNSTVINKKRVTEKKKKKKKKRKIVSKYTRTRIVREFLKEKNKIK